MRYDSSIFGGGWLCTDGFLENAQLAGEPASRVRIVWERIWWQPGGDARAPPTDPDAPGSAALRPLVQALGRLGFIEPLSVFPVRYVDQRLAVFNFQAFTVTTTRLAAEE